LRTTPTHPKTVRPLVLMIDATPKPSPVMIAVMRSRQGPQFTQGPSATDSKNQIAKMPMEAAPSRDMPLLLGVSYESGTPLAIFRHSILASTERQVSSRSSPNGGGLSTWSNLADVDRRNSAGHTGHTISPGTQRQLGTNLGHTIPARRSSPAQETKKPRLPPGSSASQRLPMR